MKNRTLLLLNLVAACAFAANLPAAPDSGLIENENHSLAVQWKVTKGALTYQIWSVAADGTHTEVLGESPLGLVRADTDFRSGLVPTGATGMTQVDENYTVLSGKQRTIHHTAVEQTLSFESASREPLTVTFHLSSDYVAFRYGFPSSSFAELKLKDESTGFKLPGHGDAWMLPYETIAECSPSYEMPWQNRIPIGTASTLDGTAGWAFPALFHADNRWTLITEAGIDGSCYAAHLQPTAPNGLYTIRLPEDAETYGVAPKEATFKAPWLSPWRLIVTGATLAPIVETTAVTDLSAPSEIADTSWIKPGRVSWSWWSDKSSPADYNRLIPFIDLSADYQWEYSLVDGGWENMTRGTVPQLQAYAEKSHVGLILWYNSGGKHNRVFFGLRDLMDDPAKREKEMARIEALGIKGMKIDFMQSDKQYLMKLYIDILRDAAKHHLFVDFHGATTPRGWARTFPNLLSQEGVRGVEQYWDINYANQSAQFDTIYPFTRNVVGSMDFTPVVFNDSPNLQRHQNTHGHELALSVAFESGLQHFVDSVSAYRAQPDFVQEFLSKVPVTWDETRYLDGVPGELALIARRHGDRWFVACLNGESVAKNISVPLFFLGAQRADAVWIHDGQTQFEFQLAKGTVDCSSRVSFKVQPKGGFVGVLQLH